MSKDIDWGPGATLAILSRRAALLSRSRAFFAQRNVLEIETPVLGAYGITEPYVENMAVEHGEQMLWLRTSPEYHMKRLLAAGGPDLYQIGKCFRANERGSRHQPEFTMIEWYRRDFTLAQMYSECCELIIEMSSDSEHPISEITVHSYADLFAQRCAVDPLTADRQELEAAARLLLDSTTCDALSASPRCDRHSWLDLLASHVVYPTLENGRLHVVNDYPADQAMLARLCAHNPAVAERFEIFLNGLELANGFRELADSTEQARRFENDRASRRKLRLPDMLPDRHLLAALSAGLPDCCGVALGFDRTLMAIDQLPSIDQTMAFTPGH